MKAMRQFVVIYIAFLVQITFSKSSKKGFGICSRNFKCGDTYSFGDASWWYDWRYDQGELQWNNCSKPPKTGYIPMIFGELSTYSAVIPPEAEYVLGFNEPNIPGQSNITAKRAAELWPLVEQKAEGRTLISPALAGCDFQPGMCIGWYDEFFATCKSCRIDAIALHSYACQPYQMMQSLERISTRYNRPIWLTEFSCKGNVTVEEDMNFMKVAIPLLEKAPFVHRYTWFCSRVLAPTTFMPNFSTDLLQRDSSIPTKLGELYNSY